jgi:general secretion pathway protein G
MKRRSGGFTLVELLVVISIISILAAVLFASFSDARELARDEARKSSLKELQLALELYKSQNGTYPEAGCGVGHTWSHYTGPGPLSSWGVSCDEYIVGLVPEYLSALPTDPSSEDELDMGYKYRTNGDSYKVVAHLSVESDLVDSYAHEFARCPRGYADNDVCPIGGIPQVNSYAVYLAGAESW